MTVIWGGQDRMLDRGLADAGLRLCRQGQLVALPDATHRPHHEEPQRVNEALLQALG